MIEDKLKLTIPIGELDKPYKELTINIERDGYSFPIKDIHHVLTEATTFSDDSLKIPLTTEQLINQLEEMHEVTFTADERVHAAEDLDAINYYRISAFRRKDMLKGHMSYTELITLYQFDRYLRESLSRLTPAIEVYLKTSLARFISTNYDKYKSEDSVYTGGQAYLDENIYKTKRSSQIDVKRMLSMFAESLTGKIAKDNMIRHHVIKYGGKIPIWVLFEEITFGQFSKFVSLLRHDLLKDWCSEVLPSVPTVPTSSGINSWITAVQILRNTTAHSSKIYGQSLPYNPKFLDEDIQLLEGIENKSEATEKFQNTFFSGLLAMKKFYQDLRTSDLESWNSFLCKIDNKVKSSEVIDIEKLGFPSEWYTVLRISN